MMHRDLLGRPARLRVARLSPAGALLEVEGDQDHPLLPLPRRELPSGIAAGDAIDVFVYLDSEDMPVATVSAPKVCLGEVAFLEVTDLTSFGAFVDWGLPKELLVPKAEQTADLYVGRRYPIGLFIDDSGRLAGTMRIAELLADRGDFTPGEWVEGEAWREEPGLGVFVIVERAFLGLVPEAEPHRLTRGAKERFRVARVLPDGKIELSTRAPVREQLADDAAAILKVLSGAPAPRVSDHSSPEQIRALFGLSKKAFKRAVGGLLKQGAVRVGEDGFLVVQLRP